MSQYSVWFTRRRVLFGHCGSCVPPRSSFVEVKRRYCARVCQRAQGGGTLLYRRVLSKRVRIVTGGIALV